MSIYPKHAYFQYSVNSYFSISQSTVTIHDQQHHAEIVNTLGKRKSTKGQTTIYKTYI
jgi:hypothetical protein